MYPQKTYTIDEAKQRVEHFCAYQERCHKEVRQKLLQMRMIPEAIDLIVVHLIEHNFLNEERFAQQFALGKFRIKHWGKQRIKRELVQRDISNYNINKALKEITEADYMKSIYALAEKKLNSIKETNPYKRKKKLCDYLLYRGWEAHLVYQVAQDLLQE